MAASRQNFVHGILFTSTTTSDSANRTLVRPRLPGQVGQGHDLDLLTMTNTVWNVPCLGIVTYIPAI